MSSGENGRFIPNRRLSRTAIHYSLSGPFRGRRLFLPDPLSQPVKLRKVF